MHLINRSYRIPAWSLCLSVFFLSIGPFSSSFSQTPVPVISEIKRHKGTVKSDSSQAMVRLSDHLTPLVTDFRYATKQNFTKQKLYKDPVAFLRLPVAIALGKVNKELITKGLILKIYDAYRPYAVTKKMWEIVPDERYAANPAKGSGHNRGAAVDVTIIRIDTRQELRMPTEYDDFTEKSHHSFQDLEKEVIENRKLLRSTMEKYGFIALETEWWHYSWPNASAKFPLLDISFKKLSKALDNK